MSNEHFGYAVTALRLPFGYPSATLRLRSGQALRASAQGKRSGAA